MLLELRVVSGVPCTTDENTAPIDHVSSNGPTGRTSEMFATLGDLDCSTAGLKSRAIFSHSISTKFFHAPFLVHVNHKRDKIPLSL